MSIAIKRHFSFRNSPLSSSFTPDCYTSVAPSSLKQQSEDTDMSGCEGSFDQLEHKGFHKATLPVMISGNTAQHQPQYLHHSNSTTSSNTTSPISAISTTGSTLTESDTFNSPNTSIRSSSEYSATMGGLPKEEFGHGPSMSKPEEPLQLSPPPSLASKKARNAKNLSLNVPPPIGLPKAQPTGIDPSMQGSSPRSMSAPSSPAFIKPPPTPAPKRRPSNLGLTIKLPGTLGQTGNIKAVGGLRHHQSSPSLFSPGPNALQGGMTLPPIKQAQVYNPSRMGQFNPITTSVTSSGTSSAVSPPSPPPPMILNEMDEYDEPRSGEAKSPAYPTGPICIFDPHVYLFAEPDAELASQFDVVINVAREVLNPFDVRDKKLAEEAEEARAMGFSRRESMVPGTAFSDISFSTAYEEPTFSPITPTQSHHQWPTFPKKEDSPPAASSEKRPEYIHMPWDHNTPIVNELPDLVKIIRDRVAAGKRVLVHCQCGVSRSASLLIAYSLFTKPTQTVQEAYDSVKNRSRWIGPNMSLIYQLSEWKTKLGKEDMGQPGFGQTSTQTAKPTKNLGRNVRTLHERLAAEDDGDSMPEPLTAPLPHIALPISPMMAERNHLPIAKPKNVPAIIRTRSENGGLLGIASPGPSSAPPGMISIPHNMPPTPNFDTPEDYSSQMPSQMPSHMPSQMPAQPTYAPPPPPLRASASSYSLRAVEPPKFLSPLILPTTITTSSATNTDNNTKPPRSKKLGFDLTPEQEANNGDDKDDDHVGDNVKSPTNAFKSSRASGYFGFGVRRDPGGLLVQDPRSPTRAADTSIVRSIFDVFGRLLGNNNQHTNNNNNGSGSSGGGGSKRGGLGRRGSMA